MRKELPWSRSGRGGKALRGWRLGRTARRGHRRLLRRRRRGWVREARTPHVRKPCPCSGEPWAPGAQATAEGPKGHRGPQPNFPGRCHPHKALLSEATPGTGPGLGVVGGGGSDADPGAPGRVRALSRQRRPRVPTPRPAGRSPSPPPTAGPPAEVRRPDARASLRDPAPLSGRRRRPRRGRGRLRQTGGAPTGHRTVLRPQPPRADESEPGPKTDAGVLAAAGPSRALCPLRGEAGTLESRHPRHDSRGGRAAGSGRRRPAADRSASLCPAPPARSPPRRAPDPARPPAGRRTRAREARAARSPASGPRR